MSNENHNIRPIPKEDPRRNIIIQRPRIIYNHKTRDSYITLEINPCKEYILKHTVHLHERSIRIPEEDSTTSFTYYTF